MEYRIVELPPAPDEYVELRKRAGLSPKSLEAAAIGLPNSLYAVHFRKGEQLVAMGRIIGDGGCFFEIVDIAVDPDYQGEGIGKLVMALLDGWLETAACDGSYVSMIADKPGFYEKLGYQKTSPEAEGMYKRLSKKQAAA
ncbi:GNAT family N-acetyltransferase [Spongorhabdus nitratireducens]